jgi:hypothetical protein
MEYTYQKITEALILEKETINQHLEDYGKKKKLKPENARACFKLTSKQ